jgi:hypothetical protein
MRRAVRGVVEELESRQLLSVTTLHPKVRSTHSKSPLTHNVVLSTKAHPDYFRVKTGPASGGSTSPSGYTPASIEVGYGVNKIAFGKVTGNGSGQTIAIVDAYDYSSALSDLNAFSTHFGLQTFNSGSGSPTFTKYNEYGSTSSLPGNDPAGANDGDWEIEEALDIEWAHSIAPEANIDLIEAASPTYYDLFTADAAAATLPGVSQVSDSWSGEEFYGENAYDSTFVQPGVTYLFASGDGGAYAGTQYPAASPDVLAIGGTTLSVGRGYNGETGWSGSGGGVSSYEPIPSYQVGKINGVSATTRAEPDVSMDANPSSGVPIYDTYDLGPSTPWAEYGGTSLATPMWAGLIAIANQGRAIAGVGSLGGATQTNQMIYNLPSTDFHDITSGSNGYPATTGYDLVTGIGSPIANLLVPALAATPDVTSNPASQTVTVGTTVQFTAAATGATSVQWMVETAGSSSFSPISGATSTTLNIGTATYAQSGNQYEAVFYNGSSYSNTTAPATLSVDPTWLSTASIATWNATTSTLTVTGAATIDADPGTDEPIIYASGTAAVLTLDPASGTDIHVGGLSLTDGASAVVTSLGAARSVSNYFILVIGVTGATATPIYTIDSTSTLDLADNDMAILYGSGTSPLSSVVTQLSDAYDSGAWDMPGLTSSVAATTGGVTGLGYGEAAALGYSTFDGVTLGGNAVLVKYTLVGDTQLRGSVGIGDYDAILSNYGNATGWSGGDFTYGGDVGIGDYDAVLTNYGESLADILPGGGS